MLDFQIRYQECETYGAIAKRFVISGWNETVHDKVLPDLN